MPVTDWFQIRKRFSPHAGMEVGVAVGRDDPYDGNHQHLKSNINFDSLLIAMFVIQIFILLNIDLIVFWIFEKPTWIKDEVAGGVLPELLMLSLKWVRG